MRRPTPETDAVAAYEGNWDKKALRMTAHARRLERQRDEEREDYRAKLREMNSRHTPETDATAEKNIYGVACKVDVDFARKLERERDEAREEIRDWKRLHDAAERGVDLTIAEGTISDLLKQRDEARARLSPDRALEWLRVHYQAWFGDRTEWSDDIADRFYKDTATLTLFCQNFKFSKEAPLYDERRPLGESLGLEWGGRNFKFSKEAVK